MPSPGNLIYYCDAEPIEEHRSLSRGVHSGRHHKPYTAARQRLGISPRQAFWLTKPSDLQGLHGPKVYRVGTWRGLSRIQGIEAAMAAAEAKVVDLPD